MKLSKRAQLLKPSPTLALAARAKELVAQGKDVISLSVGEPDWPTFPAAVKAGIGAIEKGQTKYGPASGLPELRKAVAEATTRELGVPYKPNEVTITAGAKFVIFSTLQALIESGDEVLIPTPYWVSYPTMVELADGTPRIIETTKGHRFKMTGSDLARAITPKTKMLILNSPSNPTGETYTREELKELANVLLKNPQVIVLSDDIYNRLVFDDSQLAPHLLHVAPELKDRVIIINGASKTFSMTGWRVGWALGPANVIQAMTDYQSQSVSCAAGFAQSAALVALQDCAQDLRDSLQTLKERRDFGVERIRGIPGLSLENPTGAFYLWVDISGVLGRSFKGQKVSDSGVFCKLLLEEFGVAAVPGKEFGTEGYMRLSYALKKDRMALAFDRLRDFVASLSK